MQISFQTLLCGARPVLRVRIENIAKGLRTELAPVMVGWMKAYLTRLRVPFPRGSRRLTAQLAWCFEYVQVVPVPRQTPALLHLSGIVLLPVVREDIVHMLIQPVQFIPNREAKVLNLLQHRFVRL